MNRQYRRMYTPPGIFKAGSTHAKTLTVPTSHATGQKAKLPVEKTVRFNQNLQNTLKSTVASKLTSSRPNKQSNL